MDKSIAKRTFVSTFFSAINAILCSISGDFGNCMTTSQKCVIFHEKTDINVEREQGYNFNRGYGINRKKFDTKNSPTLA